MSLNFTQQKKIYEDAALLMDDDEITDGCQTVG